MVSRNLNISETALMEFFRLPGFEGMCGATCEHCGCTANVRARNYWICECGQSNHPGRGNLPIFQFPDIGPTEWTIMRAQAADDADRRWNALTIAERAALIETNAGMAHPALTVQSLRGLRNALPAENWNQLAASLQG